MVDARRVIRLLQRIREDVERLEQRAAHESRDALRRDFDRLAAVKYLFVTAIEGSIDVAQHLCASEGWSRPEANAAALRELGRRGVLSAERAEALARAVGFRNVLVHGYTNGLRSASFRCAEADSGVGLLAEVEDERVLAQLDHVDELAGFVREVSAWIETRS